MLRAVSFCVRLLPALVPDQYFGLIGLITCMAFYPATGIAKPSMELAILGKWFSFPAGVTHLRRSAKGTAAICDEIYQRFFGVAVMAPFSFFHLHLPGEYAA